MKNTLAPRNHEDSTVCVRAHTHTRLYISAYTHITHSYLNLCAITIVVRPRITKSRASCTIFSLSLSKALVASSRSRILGSMTMARAMAILCF